MNSDTPTPRTYAYINELLYSVESNQHSRFVAICDFARTLERELAEAKRQSELYNKDTFHVIEQRDRVIQDRDRWREMARELAGELRNKTQIHSPALTRFNAMNKEQP